MERKIAQLKNIRRPAAILDIVRYLLRDEAISGKLIIGATIIALFLANSPLRGSYDSFWHLNLSIGLGDWSLVQDLRHWVNEGLMTIFFLVVGLEIKRETVQGELEKFETAVLPIAAALGGMLVPALLYMAINAGSAGFQGWAIPMATDIALAVGLLALLGRRIPASLKLFLLTLAIVDDIGAIIIIAMFYSSGFNLLMLGLVIALVAALIILREKSLLNLPLFLAVGVGLWLAISAAGVHASITGAILGLLAPVGSIGQYQRSLAERLERFSIPLSTLLVIPVFALANTGIVLSLQGFDDSASKVAWGILAGLVLGKVVGIAGTSWLMVKAGWATLPTRADWPHIVGIGLLAGIGFTVSIFVTDLVFVGNNHLAAAAKLSIFGASVISGGLGLLVLRFLPRSR